MREGLQVKKSTLPRSNLLYFKLSRLPKTQLSNLATKVIRAISLLIYSSSRR